MPEINTKDGIKKMSQVSNPVIKNLIQPNPLTLLNAPQKAGNKKAKTNETDLTADLSTKNNLPPSPKSNLDTFIYSESSYLEIKQSIGLYEPFNSVNNNTGATNNPEKIETTNPESPEKLPAAEDKQWLELKNNLEGLDEQTAHDILKNAVDAKVTLNSKDFASYLNELNTALANLKDLAGEEGTKILASALNNTTPGQELSFLQTVNNLVDSEKIAQDRMRVSTPTETIENTIDPTEIKETGEVNKTGEKDNLPSLANLKLNFNLFFSLSERISQNEVQNGTTSSEQFYQTTRTVSAQFQADFSLSTATVNGFLENSDILEKIAPETLDKFYQAVEGLANFDAPALDKFYEATDKLFQELGAQFENGKEILAPVAEAVKDQAEHFLTTVNQLVDAKMPSIELQGLFDKVPWQANDFFQIAEKLGKADMPEAAVQQLRAGVKANGIFPPKYMDLVRAIQTEIVTPEVVNKLLDYLNEKRYQFLGSEGMDKPKIDTKPVTQGDENMTTSAIGGTGAGSNVDA